LIDDFVQDKIQDSQIPGLSISVLKDGQSFYSKGYGIASIENSYSASDDTVYEIGSITKPLTSIAIMMLVEEKQIQLNDTIPTYIQDLPSAWSNITVKQLLNHTSGIKDYTDSDINDWIELASTDHSQKEIIEMVSNFPLEFQPGTAWDYSNTGYFLLGMIIESVSEMSYWEFLSSRMFIPLNMNDTQPSGEFNQQSQRKAIGYELINENFESRKVLSASTAFAAGGITSTVLDLEKWYKALIFNQLISQDSLNQIWEQTILLDGTVIPYGFGWIASETNNGLEVNHGGNTPGFTSIIYNYADNITVIMLMNKFGGERGAITSEIAHIVRTGK